MHSALQFFLDCSQRMRWFWEKRPVGSQRARTRGVIVSHARRGERILPLDQAHSFGVYTKERLALAVGDTVRLTKNHHHDDHRFINNDVLKVARIDGHELTLSNGKVMDTKKLLHLDQGHVVTSWRSKCGHSRCVVDSKIFTERHYFHRQRRRSKPKLHSR
jgi:hypothetical protein